MKIRKEILSQINELESGIIPFFVWFIKSDSGFITGVNEKRWTGVESDDSVKMKRKFRKLYRKACKKYGISSGGAPSPRFKSRLVKKYLLELLEPEK